MKVPALAQAIAGSVGDARGEVLEAIAAEPVSGGCIHRAFKLTVQAQDARRTLFVKVNEAARKALFAAEADGLAALRAAGALRVPDVVVQDDDGDHAWLVLEWLELVALGEASGAALGAALARQHRLPQARFGWPRDNFIGATPQLNGESDDWLAFWREKRLHPQLRLAAHNRYPSRMIDRGERLLADCESFFRGYAPAPSLLHGDLWGGNASATTGGDAVVFDPAVHVGDREADLAMTELFGGFPAAFQAAYREAWPLDAGYVVRRELYNLYHRLNHANLFAGGYVRESEQSIERLLAEVR